MLGLSDHTGRTLNDRIVEGLAQGILVLDARGRLVTANPAARAVLRLSSAVEGQDVSTVLAGVPALASVAGRALAEPGQGEPRVIQVDDGHPARALAVQWRPLAGEVPGGVVLEVMDLTALRAAEVEDRRAATLTGIGRLTSHVAHEIKNPLGALKLYALLLSRQLREARPESRELAEKIARAVDHLSSLVTELSAFGAPGSLESAPVALSGLADACLDTLGEQVRAAGVQVERRYDAGPATVRADARTLGQAIGAFMRNALEAMPAGGTLTVGVGAVTPSGVEMTVRDTGPGIPAEVQARLFEPFVTTKADGVGLGMVTARHVVEQHGGRVEVRTQAGAGTTVRVVLPEPRQAGDDGRGTHSGR